MYLIFIWTFLFQTQKEMDARMTSMDAKMVRMQTTLEANHKIMVDTQNTILEILNSMVASQNFAFY